MSVEDFRHPTRVAEYDSNGNYYPRELFVDEATKRLYMRTNDGSSDIVLVDNSTEKADTTQLKSGTVIMVNNSAYTPVKGLKLFGKTTQFTTTGKNLLNYEIVASYSGSGVTSTIDENGYITLTNTTASNTQYPQQTITDFKGTLYTTIEVVSITGGTIYVGNASNDYSSSINSVGTKTFTKEVDGYFRFMVSLGAEASIKFRAIVSADSNTDYEPYTGGKVSPNPDYPQELDSVGVGGSVGVTVAGKNLFPKASAGSKSSNGITFTSNGDGSYSVKGTATATTTLWFSLEENCVLLESTYLHCMNNVNMTNKASFLVGYSDNNTSYWGLTPTNRIAALTKNFGKTITKIGISVNSGNTADFTFSPMIVFSDTAMDFVPYQPIQTITAATPNGLPGIPVSSGGNYTDENGQQWICDEIDFARGVYVQRVLLAVFDGSGDEKWGTWNTNGSNKCMGTNDYNKLVKGSSVSSQRANGLCSHFAFVPAGSSGTWGENIGVSVEESGLIRFYDSAHNTTVADWTAFLASNPVTCLFQRITPIETALSAEELEAYTVLHTNKPNTTVLNDAGVDMEIAYYTPNSAVPVVFTPKDEGKVLSIDEHGCVALRDNADTVYGVCESEASITAKTATITGYELNRSGIVVIKFTNSVPANATLNISSKGAVPIYYRDKRIIDNVINAGDTATFIYDGYNYYLITIDKVDSFSMKKPVYTATPSNFITVISTAEPGSTITLEAGNYRLLTLTGSHNTVPGYTAYPENLTITGTHDAIIEGVSITSGIKDQTIHSAYPRSSEYGCVNPDISDAILPGGLTFRNVSFYNSFSLRNSQVDNLTFDDCQFMNGSFINVDPNRMEDLYGNDYTKEDDIALQNRPYYAKLTPKNLVIRDCVFNGTHPTSDLSAIRIQSVDGITVYRNAINSSRRNGVNIGGVSDSLYDSYSTGKISVSNNKIYNTKDRSIRLYTIRDADVLIAANELQSANQSTSYTDVIKASGCIDTTFTVIANNTYNGSDISEGNKITLQSYETSISINAYGTCDTASSTGEKVVTLVDNTNWTLIAGNRVSVLFTYTNTEWDVFLNVNGTGKKRVKYNGRTLYEWDDSDLNSYGGHARRIIDYVYDGEYYVFMGWSVPYDNASLGCGYGICNTAEATAAKTSSITGYELVHGGIVAIKFTNAVPANATLNISSNGAKSIYYRGAKIVANVINAGDTATFIYNGTGYLLISLDRNNDTTYTFNGAVSTIKDNNLTASRALVSDSSGKVAVSAVTNTELGYLDGVSSNIQTQLNDKAKVTYKTYSAFDTASTGADGWYTLFTLNDSTTGSALCLLKGYAHSSVVFTVSKGYSTNTTLNVLDYNESSNGSYAYIKALRTLSDGKVQAQINTGTVNISINIISANGTLTPAGSLICDTTENPEVCITRTLYQGKMVAGGFVGNLTGNADTATKATQDGSGNVIASTYETKTNASAKLTEAKTYTDTVASGKANSSHNHAASNITSGTLSSDRLPTVPIAKGGTGATTAAAALTNLGITATAAELNKMDGVTATTTELNYVDGVTSNIQTQLNAKQATITGAATTITGSNLTANRALISNGSGKVAVSAVTSTELGYLDGVTSNIQTQLDTLGVDYIVEQGTSGDWTYRKWNSGLGECWATVTNVGTNGGTETRVIFPFPFIGFPADLTYNATITGTTSSDSGTFYQFYSHNCEPYVDPSTSIIDRTKSGSLRFIVYSFKPSTNEVNVNSTTTKTHLYVTGKWK